MRTLVIGIGNEFLGDDGVGPRLARDLATGPGALRGPGVEVAWDGHLGGLELMERMIGCDRAAVIDAIDTLQRASGERAAGVGVTGRQPPTAAPRDETRRTGRLCHATLAAPDALPRLTGVHDIDLPTALELGRRAGLPLPRGEDVHVFAVQARIDRVFSDRLSPEMMEHYPELLGLLRRRLGGLLGC